jgi:hypothetical protein
MALDRIPAEDHLDLLLSFARVSPAIAPYEEIAKSKGLRIIEESFAPEYRLFKCSGFGLMLIDEVGKKSAYSGIARLHCIGLFEEVNSEDEVNEELGVASVSSMEDLRQAYDRLYQKLRAKLGMPTQEDIWIAELMMGMQDETEEEFAYAAWQLSNSLLVLLLNDEGDMHIGEDATVDIRIAPLARQEGLPNSVSDPWGWPVEY